MQKVWIVRKNPAHIDEGGPAFGEDLAPIIGVYANKSDAVKLCSDLESDHWDDCSHDVEECDEAPYIVSEHVVN